MPRKESDASDSSDDDDDVNLREALAPGFTIEAVKQTANGEGSKALPSRQAKPNNKNTSGQFVAPVVSDSNQKYLAKELSKYLDKSLEEDFVSVVPSSKSTAALSKDDGGVKLLSTSKDILQCDQYTCEEEESVPRPKKCPRKRKLSSSESDRVKESVVDAEWVLQKKGDYGPLCRKPGELIEGAVHAKTILNKAKKCS